MKAPRPRHKRTPVFCPRLGPGFAIVLLSGFAVACVGREAGGEGKLPEKLLQGTPVALTIDSAGGTLLMAHLQALYASTDSGRHWKAVGVPPSVRRGRIAAVAAPRASPGTVYLAGPGIGVIRSSDGGRMWLDSGAGLPNQDVVAFAAHATKAATLYAVVSGIGLFRTEDGGTTWLRMEAGPGSDIRQLFHSDMAGSMETGWLFAALATKVRRSMDCFCGWRDAGALRSGQSRGAELHSVTYDPRYPSHVYASTTAGVFHSTDGGSSWEFVSPDAPAKLVLAFDSAEQALYGGALDGTFWRSGDRGRSWERLGPGIAGTGTERR